jgi:hypothetical protein
MGFRAWTEVSPVPQAERSGEWAASYPGWAKLYAAFDAFMARSHCREWSNATTDLIIYAVARDSDINHLIKSIARDPDDLLCFAERASASPEEDAKWQIATELGHLSSDVQQVEAMLLKYVNDSDEYVRRCALLALAAIGSPVAEELAERAWACGSEYQRVDILYILWSTHSAKLDQYIASAEADPSQYVADYATQLRSGNV